VIKQYAGSAIGALALLPPLPFVQLVDNISAPVEEETSPYRKILQAALLTSGGQSVRDDRFATGERDWVFARQSRNQVGFEPHEDSIQQLWWRNVVVSAKIDPPRMLMQRTHATESPNSAIDLPAATPSTSGFYSGLLAKQERLGEEFERVLFDNLWDLYAR
jgi:hypothetical protein